MRTFWRAMVSGLAVLTLTAATGIATPTSALAHSSCAVHWGSLPKAVTTMTSPPAPMNNVRAGRHACFDRLVVDVPGGVARAYIVSYVPEVATEGDRKIPLRGGAYLSVDVGAPSYDTQTGTQTYRPAHRDEVVDVTGWRTFRQVAYGGSFEGYTLLGLGVRARLPFRVMVLPGPGTGSRLVIDVAHSWQS